MEFEILVVVFIVCLTGTSFILVSLLRDATRQIVKMNEQLLIVAGVKTGGDPVGRALVASARTPKKDLPGIVSGPQTSNLGQAISKPYTLTVGGV